MGQTTGGASGDFGGETSGGGGKGMNILKMMLSGGIGGLQGMTPPSPPGNATQLPNIPQAPAIDFNQLNKPKSNPFWGQ